MTRLTFASAQSFFVCLFGRDELKERPHFFMSFYEKRALDRDSRAEIRGDTSKATCFPKSFTSVHSKCVCPSKIRCHDRLNRSVSARRRLDSASSSMLFFTRVRKALAFCKESAKGSKNRDFSRFPENTNLAERKPHETGFYHTHRCSEEIIAGNSIASIGTFSSCDSQNFARFVQTIFAGKDVVVQAHTGSGKTLVYSLPILSHIDTSHSAIQAVIVVPTRELGLQVAQVLKELAAGAPKKIGIMSVVEGSKNRRYTNKKADCFAWL